MLRALPNLEMLDNVSVTQEELSDAVKVGHAVQSQEEVYEDAYSNGSGQQQQQQPQQQQQFRQQSPVREVSSIANISILITFSIVAQLNALDSFESKSKTKISQQKPILI